jgi:Fe-S cluster assembly protein SufD
MSESINNSGVIFTRSRGSVNPVVDDLKFSPVFKENEDGFTHYRKASWDTFKKTPFPTGKEESWKRTSLRELKFGELQEYTPGKGVSKEIPSTLTKPLADDLHGGQILIGAGKRSVELDVEIALKGVIFTDLESAQSKNSELLNRLVGKLIPASQDKFAALAGALATQGVLLYVPKAVHVEKPLHSLYWASGEGIANASHILVYLEEGSSVTYVHESSSPVEDEKQSIHAGLIEVYVGPGANLQFVELQSFGSNIWNFTHERVNVDRDAEVDWVFGALGSKVTKNFSDLNLIGQGSTGKMSGFYFTNLDQHLDHDTQQNHRARHTTSDLLFKGALLGDSQSVWKGNIYVSPEASKTDGYQANRNLVLSEGARADSIPGLEILTDDVRCTHGATVGKMDKEQVFYLESRGIPRKTAEKLIVEGFFDPIMQRIPFEGVRNRFQNAIEEKMKEY